MIERNPRAPVLRSIARLAIAASASSVKFSVRVLKLEQALVLFDQRILRLGQDRDQRVFVQVFKRGNHRQATDEFGDQTEFQQIFGLQFHEHLTNALESSSFDIGAKADRRALCHARDDLLKPCKCATTDEQDICRIDLQEFLLRMLAPALRRHEATVPSMIFSKACCTPSPDTSRVIDGLSDLRVILSTLVDIDDAALRAFDVVFGLPATASE